jgi:hypothetical protein
MEKRSEKSIDNDKAFVSLLRQYLFISNKLDVGASVSL